MTYSWLHSSSTEKILAQNERRFISLDGTLFFSYLLPEDDDSYACSLSVYATQAGSYGPFFRLVANTTTHRSFAARLDSTQPQLFPAQPMPGEAVYLECFAYGSPLPKYKWQRVDGKPLPKRAHVTNHGRVLKIDKVRPSDAGKYRCVASNAHGASSGDVLLKLRARPTIVQGLYDRLVATSSNVQLECVLSNADSYSSIEWFKNAKPIVPLLLPPAQRKRLTIANHILTIKSANEHDTGIYQCVVSNEVGSSTSSALITVKDVAPRFPPGAVPRRVYATIGTRIRIPCVFEASPLGYGSWADAGGRQLNTTNGVLEFENVTKTEAGLYFCTARNRQGKAHTQVDLVVMDKKTNETESLSCQLEITCNDATACNDLMNDGRLACATAASPIALTAHPTENGFRLRWRLAPSAERQHRGARDHTSANVRDSAAYVVEMRTRRERRWHRADNRSLVEIAPTRASLINLPPNTELQFRVRAVDASGTPGTASAPSEWFKTPPSAPTEAIDGLKWRSVDRDTILVEWQPLANSAGDNLRYRVTWNDASNSSEVANQLDIDHPQAIIRLANSPEPCRTVELSVRAVNDQGSAEMSTDTVAFVSGRGRLPTVRMHNVRPLNATHVNVTWTWQEQSDCDFRNAVMISCKHRNKSTIVETTVIDTTTTLIGDLEADSAYNCTITAVDNHGNFGPPSEVFVIHTKEKQPTEAPKILKLMMKRLENDYTTILEWTAVELQKSASSNNSLHSKLEHKHHHGCGYRIFIYISETATIPVELDMSWHRLSDKQHPSARLDGLKLMYKYTVQVAAYNPGGIGPLSEPKSIRLGSHASLDLSSSSLSSSASTSSLLFRTIQLLSVHMLLLIL